jgi:hypothetical protein
MWSSMVHGMGAAGGAGDRHNRGSSAVGEVLPTAISTVSLAAVPLRQTRPERASGAVGFPFFDTLRGWAISLSHHRDVPAAVESCE